MSGREQGRGGGGGREGEGREGGWGGAGMQRRGADLAEDIGHGWLGTPSRQPPVDWFPGATETEALCRVAVTDLGECHSGYHYRAPSS